ncbi:MAG: hypothetical protein K2W94_03310 [Alphaproteobacteria bacterium]|nr:hypothetical protein [Alphaproteobacteria bacterium]
MMNKLSMLLIVFISAILVMPIATNVYGSDGEEELVIHKRKRKVNHILSDSEDGGEEENEEDVSFVANGPNGTQENGSEEGDEESEGEESNASNGQPIVFKYCEETRNTVINAVRSGQYHCRQQIADSFGLVLTTVDGCLSQLRRAGLLTSEELKSVNLVDQRTFRHEVVALIKEKKSEQEILDYCYASGASNPRERTDNYLSRKYLTALFQDLYNRTDLTPKLTSKDVDYLKLKGTVVGRRGETKGRIVEFFEERSKHAATQTRKKLADEFNDFVWAKYNIRAIATETFVEHVKKLIEKDVLSKQQADFFEACKEEKQKNGYIPTSRKAKRKKV